MHENHAEMDVTENITKIWKNLEKDYYLNL